MAQAGDEAPAVASEPTTAGVKRKAADVDPAAPDLLPASIVQRIVKGTRTNRLPCAHLTARRAEAHLHTSHCPLCERNHQPTRSGALPPGVSIAKDGKEAFTKAASIFVMYLTAT